jgi:hypothetical protein
MPEPAPDDPPARSADRYRWLLVAMMVSVLTVTTVAWLLVVIGQQAWLARSFGVDFRILMDGLDRWRATGEWYRPRQLSGPYPIEIGDILYPPVVIYLLVPFHELGPLAWSIIPVAIVGWAVWRHRPTLWALVLIAGCVAWPFTPAKFVFGNPVIWATAMLALATFRGWPAAFLLLKPTIAPLALFGIRDRRWWLAVGALVILSLPLLQDTLRYPEVLLNAQTNVADGRGGPLYSLTELPLLAIPLLAWLGRRRGVATVESAGRLAATPAESSLSG